MFLSHYLLFEEFVYTTPCISDKESSFLDYVVHNFNKVIFNYCPEEIERVPVDVVYQIFGRNLSMGKGQGLMGIMGVTKALAKRGGESFDEGR